MPQKYLAVVGLGPKGAAIAAKASALREAGFDSPEVIIFEPHRVGAAWSGQFGYTDGQQELCTLAERDVGFPYDRGSFSDPGVARATFNNFSWHTFAVAAGVGATRYDEWVLKGRRPPLHREFAEYLKFVVSSSHAQIVPEAVTVVDYDHARKAWTIFTTGNKRYPVWFDGVVVTGSGPPLPSLPGANARVFDGLTFWQNLPAVSALLDQEHPEDQSVAIIGGGGTSAAVALWFSRTGIKKIPVNIIGREATLYARVPSYFEDRLFSDNSEWKTLAPHAQDAFLGRLAQGVVWNTVLQGLHKSENLTYRSFSARGFRMDSVSANPPGLILELDYPGPAGASPGSPVELQPATVFVDARGFNNWWFVDLLVPRGPLRQFFSQTTRTSVMNNIDDALAIRGDLPSGGRFPPGLHVPMIASRQGPGAPNLMALGWMSDQILVPHTSP